MIRVSFSFLCAASLFKYTLCTIGLSDHLWFMSTLDAVATLISLCGNFRLDIGGSRASSTGSAFERSNAALATATSNNNHHNRMFQQQIFFRTGSAGYLRVLRGSGGAGVCSGLLACARGLPSSRPGHPVYFSFLLATSSFLALIEHHRTLPALYSGSLVYDLLLLSKLLVVLHLRYRRWYEPSLDHHFNSRPRGYAISIVACTSDKGGASRYTLTEHRPNAVFLALPIYPHPNTIPMLCAWRFLYTLIEHRPNAVCLALPAIPIIRTPYQCCVPGASPLHPHPNTISMLCAWRFRYPHPNTIIPMLCALQE